MLFSILVIGFGFVISVCAKTECGYMQCPSTKEGVLNVHIIPHSHMDAGWVKTFEEYYYGTKSAVSTANVQLIYHTVLAELLHDKRRKFTFSETAYFWRWWKDQLPATRSTFRNLVQEGRVEFAGGGWVQNDEATVDYLHIIDQFTWGLRKINDTLGPCGKPKAAWQVDTYGHSREQASLLAQMGYDGLFIGRVDHLERQAMLEDERMEFMWRGSSVLGKMTDIMTHTLFNLYNPPDGFCFDFLCNEEPFIDNVESRSFNARKKVNDFIAYIERQAKYYNHENIMITMGGDFAYQSAAHWYINLDKLINFINTHPANRTEMNIFYSTPSCYLKAVYMYGKRDRTLYTKKSDFFPYGSDSVSYWTGYYTSRPNFKYLVKRAHAFLQVLKQLSVIANVVDSYELHTLRHAVSLSSHHDAITGTSQHHVMNNFATLLNDAMDAGVKKAATILSAMTPSWGTKRVKMADQFVVCHQLNIGQCTFVENRSSFILLIYNPLSIKTHHHVRLPANAHKYSIRDANDEDIDYQIVPLSAAIINLPGRRSKAIQEVFFESGNIPPLGYASFHITAMKNHNTEESDNLDQFVYHDEMKEGEDLLQISNEYIKVAIDKATGLLEYIENMNGVKIQVSQNFYVYNQTSFSLQSGAYSFRPDPESIKNLVSDHASFQVTNGPHVNEIRQRFTDWISQVIRLYRNEDFVEFEWVVGPVPVGNDLNKEVVSVFSTNITNQMRFSTDSNARQMMQRTCVNETASVRKLVSACYFPVSSRICIGSDTTEMCVLTDRAQGGTSYSDGEIELMVHRRLLTDDGFGLEESLNEEAFGVGLVAKGKHRIVFEGFTDKALLDKQTFSARVSEVARRWRMEPWLFFSSTDKINKRKWMMVRHKKFTGLKLRPLPRHLHILTLEPWKGSSILLRLENTYETAAKGYNKDKDMLKHTAFDITVDLCKVFRNQLVMVRETTLAANQWLDDARQMDWSTRYVYQGGDDGILPEDVKITEDKSMKIESKYVDSDETSERTQPRKKTPKKQRSRKPPKVTHDDERDDDERIKRYSKSTNITADTNLESTDQNNDMKRKFTFKEYLPKTSSTTRKPKKNDREVSRIKELDDQLFKEDTIDPSKQIEDVQKSEEEAGVAIDDEVSKSVLGMYYANNAKSRQAKTIQNPMDFLLSSKTSWMENKKCKDQMGFSDEDCNDGDDEIVRLKRQGKYSRSPKHPKPGPEEENVLQDYIITLRPTQIRTFVLWFESKKTQI